MPIEVSVGAMGGSPGQQLSLFGGRMSGEALSSRLQKEALLQAVSLESGL